MNDNYEGFGALGYMVIADIIFIAMVITWLKFF